MAPFGVCCSVTVYIEGLRIRVIGGEHREWYCLVWHVWVYICMHLCMYLKFAIGWREVEGLCVMCSAIVLYSS